MRKMSKSPEINGEFSNAEIVLNWECSTFLTPCKQRMKHSSAAANEFSLMVQLMASSSECNYSSIYRLVQNVIIQSAHRRWSQMIMSGNTVGHDHCSRSYRSSITWGTATKSDCLQPLHSDVIPVTEGSAEVGLIRSTSSHFEACYTNRSMINIEVVRVAIDYDQCMPLTWIPVSEGTRRQQRLSYSIRVSGGTRSLW
jgi:hypothetical protein